MVDNDTDISKTRLNQAEQVIKLNFYLRCQNIENFALSAWCLQNFIALCKSFVYSKKRRGPRTDPCGTPYAVKEREEL